MHFTLKRLLILLIALFLLLPAAAFAEDSNGDQDNSEETAAPIYVPDYFNDTALNLYQYEGKVVFLNFFEEWCFYCMEEMPDIKQIFEQYDPNSLEIVLVHPWNGEDASSTQSVVTKYGLDGVATVEDEDMYLQYIAGVSGYPTSLFIDANGYLAQYIPGAMNYETMTQILDDLGVPRIEDAAATPAP